MYNLHTLICFYGQNYTTDNFFVIAGFKHGFKNLIGLFVFFFILNLQRLPSSHIKKTIIGRFSSVPKSN